MGLVDYYSDSDEGPVEVEPPKSSLKQEEECAKKEPPEPTTSITRPESLPPPPPTSFRDLYAVPARINTQDDPSLHDGRKRTNPHFEGNWPTHVYLEWNPTRDQSFVLSQIVTRTNSELNGKLHSSLTSEFHTPLPLHISLSPPLLLKNEERDAYIKQLTEFITQLYKNSKDTTMAASRYAPRPAIELRLDRLKWAVNSEQNRWFLAAGIAKPQNDDLNKLLAACNAVAISRGLPTLYTAQSPEASGEAHSVTPMASSRVNSKGSSPLTFVKSVYEDHTDQFHFSIAWTLQQPSEATGPNAEKDIPLHAVEHVWNIHAAIDVVKVKIGSNIKTIPIG